MEALIVCGVFVVLVFLLFVCAIEGEDTPWDMQ